MGREKFKELLIQNNYSFYEKDGWIVLDGDDELDLTVLETLPDKVEFKSGCYVNLRSLKSYP